MEGVKAVIDEPNRGIPSEDTQIEVIRELRDLPPLHYLFKIKNFSQLYNGKIDNYDSSDFEVGGYQWRLSLYPKGNKKVNEKDHISLYLVLSESNSFPLYREVNVYLKLFIYNQIQDKYLTVQDAKGSVRRFRGMKKEWGFDQLVPLSVFNDASNGYLINDCCVFGAEVFVLEGCCKVECASAVKELDNNRYAWKFENFAELEEETYFSKVFVIGGYRWTLEVYPRI
ncbi:ubiquitin C-terminal hydrolase 12-like isoform X1 [Euphorbia lathyris]|uniref:ubiquitin C-terminal hydrolase 12-like isoform X1 n=1 Tax=Euphorbia lathyris TaxID=212925 RepID=UPI003314103E